VNVQKAAMPDLLADMNSIADLAHLPSERFDVVFVTNIMKCHFDATFFINARRLLVPNGVLIVNTLENYFPDEFGEMRRENGQEENDACLALFGFQSIRDQFDSYKPQLFSIGYEPDYFDEVISSIIYRKI
jgi:SAM-dependent methyltransferase